MSYTIKRQPDPLRDAGEHPAFDYLTVARPASCERGFYGYVFASTADQREDLPLHVTVRPYATEAEALAVVADWVLAKIEAEELANGGAR